MKLKKILSVAILSSLSCGLILGLGKTMEANANSDEFYIEKVDNMPEDFIKGADISTLIAQEQSGVKYYNESNQEEDLFTILSENGVNYARIRIWNDPYNAEGQGYGAGNCDVDKAIEMGKRATSAGMKVLIDFHYSDFWADPGRQLVPKAWKGYSVTEKADALYAFTKDSLEKIIAAGVDVGMVQVGNETTGSGICGESGNGRYDLFKAGSRAIREVDPNILIALHFTNPDRTSTILNYARDLKNNNIDYDVFATSYYAFWHGSLENLTYVLKTVSDTYGKKTMVAETSYAYTLEDGDGQKNVVNSVSQTTTGGYAASVQGQADSLRDVMDATVKAGENALGVFYWEPAWTPVGSSDRDVNMPIWEKFGSGWASTAAIGYDTAVNESNYGGSEWDNQALFDFNGKALDSLKVFKYADQGLGTVPKEESLLKNGSFENSDLSDYSISQSYVTRKADTPKSGNYALHFWNKTAVDYLVEQSIDLQPGTYRFSLAMQGDETGASEDIFAYVNIGEDTLGKSNPLQLTGLSEWKEGKVEFTLTEPTTVKVGLSVKADAGAWGTTDDWKLVEIEAPEIVEVDSIKLNVNSLNILKVNKSINLSPQVLPETATDKTITYTCDKEGIVQIDSNGTLTAKKAGTVKVTASSINGKTESFTVRVTK
ncbi:glycosyl hydrolase 53 family protein [Enterococcus faecium]|uniref:glycosyl hydrolase 53 family protein n=1 Tax=Enterococcus TaxID=1350 RepID=UPI00111E3301|nr:MULTISPECIES: glycosyl hydrolase 53 family protein [Enterococcus]EGP5553310.1 glycosyl hydrolase family 53 [Enterococcus faecium]EGP5585037.1 glycosyl hydrolase family 53 [Enterococcus faecium]EGP5735357.1 glycosyl hydrolase family 53 [Enterococcus faecium]EME3569348.1 glycosyl hydrolase 53 family protein [Enterococcus faecium]EME7156240.1 glycosyl hydrolase 53 family protein [Enterococcus faecium]